MAKRKVIVPGVSYVESGNWGGEFIVNNAEQQRTPHEQRCRSF